MSDTLTIDRVWRDAAKRLSSSDTASLDARLLAAHCLDISTSDLMLRGDAPFPSGRLNAFQRAIERRASGEPVARIIGEWEFYGLRFALSDETLVPRPDTELLVDAALERLAAIKTPQIADLGTGTGCIAIALAHERSDLTGIATDQSEKALEIAARNALRHNVDERLRFLNANWLAGVPGDFDMIVSNPPYIAQGEASSLSVEVRDHDPAVALFAGLDGLDDYRQIIPQAATKLRDGGWLLLEIGHTQADAVSTLMLTYGFSEIEVLQDLAGHDRVMSGRIFS